MSQARKIAGLSSLGLTTAVLIFAAATFLESTARFSSLILLITGIQSMAVFWLLAWALKRPGSAFYSIFMADALLRLVGLGVAVFWLTSRGMPYTGSLVTLGLAYLLFSVVQIPFFHQAH